MLRKGQEGHVRAERDVLKSASLVSSPGGAEWIVRLHYSFQDRDNLYLVGPVPHLPPLRVLLLYGQTARTTLIAISYLIRSWNTWGAGTSLIFSSSATCFQKISPASMSPRSVLIESHAPRLAHANYFEEL